ncbi:MAG: hypothetical protein ACHQ15_08010 [Candidatus Limnocylindrales bacterium]
MQLAHPTGDELGELAAEVEDDDGVRAGRPGVAGPAGRWPLLRRAIGRGRVERRLEVGLDLGVVRGQDAMARVGRLAVDRLAALLGRRSLVVRQGR